MTPLEYKARCKERRMLIHRKLVERELHIIMEKHNKAVLDHQAAMYELQKIIYESKK